MQGDIYSLVHAVTHHGERCGRCAPLSFFQLFRRVSSSLSSPSSNYSTPFGRFIDVIGLAAPAAAGAAQVLFSIASILRFTLLSAFHESSPRKSPSAKRRTISTRTSTMLPRTRNCRRPPHSFVIHPPSGIGTFVCTSIYIPGYTCAKYTPNAPTKSTFKKSSIKRVRA